MTIQEFFDKWNNQPCNPDGAYGNQCVDVADQYAVDVVDSPLPPVNGAKDFWNKNLIGYDKIPNTPDGVPQKGDIIIWGEGIGSSFGHVAIFSKGDADSFTSFDQDFPTQGYIDNQGNFIGTGVCHFQKHNDYTGVLGWFHPKDTIITQPIVQQPAKTGEDPIVALYKGILGVNPSTDELNSRKDQLKSGIVLHDIISQVLNEDARSPLLIQKQNLDNVSKQLIDCQNKPAPSPTTIYSHPKTFWGQLFESLAVKFG